jgi:hypothetical protein
LGLPPKLPSALSTFPLSVFILNIPQWLNNPPEMRAGLLVPSKLPTLREILDLFGTVRRFIQPPTVDSDSVDSDFKPRNFGLVTFTSATDAFSCIQTLDGLHLEPPSSGMSRSSSSSSSSRGREQVPGNGSKPQTPPLLVRISTKETAVVTTLWRLHSEWEAQCDTKRSMDKYLKKQLQQGQQQQQQQQQQQEEEEEGKAREAEVDEDGSTGTAVDDEEEAKRAAKQNKASTSEMPGHESHQKMGEPEEEEEEDDDEKPVALPDGFSFSKAAPLATYAQGCGPLDSRLQRGGKLLVLQKLQRIVVAEGCVYDKACGFMAAIHQQSYESGKRMREGEDVGTGTGTGGEMSVIQAAKQASEDFLCSNVGIGPSTKAAVAAMAQAENFADNWTGTSAMGAGEILYDAITGESKYKPLDVERAMEVDSEIAAFRVTQQTQFKTDRERKKRRLNDLVRREASRIEQEENLKKRKAEEAKVEAAAAAAAASAMASAPDPEIHAKVLPPGFVPATAALVPGTQTEAAVGACGSSQPKPSVIVAASAAPTAVLTAQSSSAPGTVQLSATQLRALSDAIPTVAYFSLLHFFTSSLPHLLA